LVLANSAVTDRRWVLIHICELNLMYIVSDFTSRRTFYKLQAFRLNRFLASSSFCNNRWSYFSSFPVDPAQSHIYTHNRAAVQGCQMVYFQTQNPSLGKFWRVLHWKMLVYFIVVLSILQPFCMFHGHFVYFTAILYISCSLIIFSPMWVSFTQTIWQPCRGERKPKIFPTGKGRKDERRSWNLILFFLVGLGVLGSTLIIWKVFHGFGSVHTYVGMYIHTYMYLCWYICKSTFLTSTSFKYTQ
jgi:hypothetical protein